MTAIRLDVALVVDPRVLAAAKRLGRDRYDMLGRIVSLLAHCAARRRDVLTAAEVDLAGGDLPGFAAAIVHAGIAVTTPDGDYQIVDSSPHISLSLSQAMNGRRSGEARRNRTPDHNTSPWPLGVGGTPSPVDNSVDNSVQTDVHEPGTVSQTTEHMNHGSTVVQPRFDFDDPSRARVPCPDSDSPERSQNQILGVSGPIEAGGSSSSTIRAESARRSGSKKTSNKQNLSAGARSATSDAAPSGPDVDSGDGGAPHRTNPTTKREQRAAQRRIQEVERLARLPDEAFELAHLLFESVVSTHPHSRIARAPQRTRDTTCERWAETIDRLNRIDKITWAEMRSMLAWCTKDRFWSSVILGADNLRENWDKMVAQRRSKSMSRNGASPTSVAQQELERVRGKVAP